MPPQNYRQREFLGITNVVVDAIINLADTFSVPPTLLLANLTQL